MPLIDAPLTPLCAPAVARRLAAPADLAREMLLRSYRPAEWQRWFEAAGAACPPLRGPVFDASPTMAAAAASGVGVGLLPARLFEQDLAGGRLVRPFETEIAAGRYWLTRLLSRPGKRGDAGVPRMAAEGERGLALSRFRGRGFG